MICPQCAHDTTPGARFCNACGTPLVVACPVCRQLCPVGSRFCSACGHELVEPPAARLTPTTSRPPAPPAAPRRAQPESYTPRHLAERILTSKAALEGERKQITVLFADVKGSLELLTRRDPEDAQRLLDPVLQLMMDAVHYYEGTVNQVMGDGIMALFGAPLAHEDHAVRACYAALRMQEAARRHAEAVQPSEGAAIQLRIGLNSGEVVVRSIGSDLRMDYTAVGETTHLAARMEQMAEPGTILITADTVHLAEGRVQVRALGPRPVKGLGEPVEVFELTGASGVHTRLQATAAGGFTRFVGRRAEMEQLRRAVDAAGRGRGQLVAVLGEPGVGKSRLVWELTRSCWAEGWLVLESAAASYGKGRAYLPVINLLKAYFAVEPRDTPPEIREKVLGKVLALDQALASAVPALLALLDVTVDEPAWRSLEPPQRRSRILEAVTQIFLRASQVQPLVLVVEDVHWVDSESQAVLDRLVERLPLARILLLVNYRPEYTHSWGSKSYYTQLGLEPLAAESAGELLDALLGPDAGLRPLKRFLAERTEGNPFFLEECVRTLIETRVLVGERGHYRATRSVESIQVPATVQAILAARIDRLSPEDKRTLQEASVIGEHVPFALLHAVVGVPEEELRATLRRLQAAELLYEIRHPEEGYTFRHGLTYQVAYNSLLHERHRLLDARIVECMERLYPDRLGEHLDRLAHHALRGEVWVKAAHYCREAGLRASARSAHRSAAAHLEQALTALTHLQGQADLVARGFDVRLDLRNALSPLGEYGRMLEVMTEAEALAQRLGDQRRLGLVSAFLTNFFTLQGDFDRAVEHGGRALGLAHALADTPLSVLASAMLSLAYYGQGRYRAAIAQAERDVELLQGDLAHERFGMALLPAVYSRTVMVWSLAQLGEFARGRAVGEQGVQIAEQSGHLHSMIFAHLGTGTVHLRRGAVDDALAALERAHELWEKADLPAVLLELAGPLASAYALAGRAPQAIALLEQAIEQAIALRHRLGYVLKSGGLAEAYLAAGRVDEALPLAELYVAITQQVNARGGRAWALQLLAEAAARSDPPDAARAETAIAEGLALARELGMRPLEARYHLTRGSLYARTGAPDADGELVTAARLFAELDMDFWRERAEGERQHRRA